MNIRFTPIAMAVALALYSPLLFSLDRQSAVEKLKDLTENSPSEVNWQDTDRMAISDFVKLARAIHVDTGVDLRSFKSEEIYPKAFISNGLLKRNGRVYTVAVPNTQSATLLPIIREQVKPDSIVYTDTYRSYDLLDVSEFSHINHSTHFAENHNHINGIENFWSQAKRHLRKFNGIPKAHFELYLKECEWRFNYSDIKTQIPILKQLVKGSLV
ncbi:Transposase and inactivated derivatives [uncultured Avibacterium sp.]|uniref:Transposase and inactivated derivatives n=1 Tax=uncultured Avibacterium sp. TaxID=1936169 RepID=A0A486XHA5_9PAST|nr:Transposase and inactivated derivatives [uncultured Avibacterium sp.]